MLKIYALSYGARRPTPTGEQLTSNVGYTLNARSDEEAVGIALKMAKLDMPESEGYHSYWATKIEIKPEHIAKVYKSQVNERETS